MLQSFHRKLYTTNDIMYYYIISSRCVIVEREGRSNKTVLFLCLVSLRNHIIILAHHHYICNIKKEGFELFETFKTLSRRDRI